MNDAISLAEELLHDDPECPCTQDGKCEHYYRCASELIACVPFRVYARRPGKESKNPTDRLNNLANITERHPTKEHYNIVFDEVDWR